MALIIDASVAIAWAIEAQANELTRASTRDAALVRAAKAAGVALFSA